MTCVLCIPVTQAELAVRNEADHAAMSAAFEGPELPFTFGYGAYPEECLQAEIKRNKPLGDRGKLPCNGILLAAWRRRPER